METFVEPTYPIVRREMFDEEILKKILVDDRYSQADRKLMSAYYKNKRNAGEAQVIYQFGAGCDKVKLGRLFAQNSLGIANWSWTMRNPLAQKWYWDIDIVNCHYRIAVQFCIKYGLSHCKISHYCDNRNEMLAKVCPSNRNRAKMEFLKILYGGDIKLYSCYVDEGEGTISAEGFEYLSGLKSEIENLMDTIWMKNEQYHDLRTGSDFGGKNVITMSKKSNKKASLMSLLFQTEERKMLMLIAEFFRINGRYMGVFIHDGGYVEKISNEVEFPRHMLDNASIEIKKHLGYDVVLEQKPITHQWEPKEPLVGTVNPFAEWEVTNCKVLTASTTYVEKRCNNDGETQFIFRTEKQLVSHGRHKPSVIEKVIDRFCEIKEIRKPFITAWITNEAIRRYDDFGCYPSPLVCPPNIFNLWVPFRAELLPECDVDETALLLFKTLMFYLGGKDYTVAEYLTQWLAQALQFPAVKTGITPTLISKKGGGKGSLFETIAKLVSQKRVFSTGKPDDVFGKFNSQMESAYFVNIDEIDSKQMKYVEGELKHLQTEPFIKIENKGINAFQIKSFHRFIFTINDEFGAVVPTEDDRRNFIIRASDDLIGNRTFHDDYHEKVVNSNTGIKTIYNYLMSIKGLDKFLHIKKPRTEYESELLKLNRSPYETWLEDFTERNRTNDETLFITTDLYKDFLNFTECKEGNKYSIKSFGIRILNIVLGGIKSGGQIRRGTDRFETKIFDWNLLRDKFKPQEYIVIDENVYQDELDVK